MKPPIFYCLLPTVLLACNDQGIVPPQAPPANLFQVHLQTGFSRVPVSISVDRAQIFYDTATTLPSLSLAAIVPAQVTQGSHKLNVTMLGTASRDTTFTILDTLFVGVHYDATTSTIGYRFQRKPFYYR